MTEHDRLLALSRTLSAAEAEARQLKRSYLIRKMLENIQAEIADQLARECGA
jgi:hypothetical protein